MESERMFYCWKARQKLWRHSTKDRKRLTSWWKNQAIPKSVDFMEIHLATNVNPDGGIGGKVMRIPSLETNSNQIHGNLSSSG